ncbi:trigger factor [Vulcanibacillus modesticaldus]|uniref:Trigger factor n=1 Tax=Vulcanibacillus modesticaldus TaxID=337097 RepID=A0A1D2YW86_9BACI|nr:trigger factor [Vulcanibacillus modesticaldus]OEF99994.1 trigger factor [Vulcanibacillus modesticaldus]
MKASWGKIENEKNKGILHVEVEAEQVAEALDKAFKKVVKQVNVPGFRKGKVPRKIFEARFGVEVLYNDALDILLPKAYEEAIKETGIEPVDRPEIDIEQLEQGKSLIFKATVTVKPEVELGEYKGLEIPEKDFTVKEEDIEEELKQLQNRHAELIIVEDGTVEQGDTAVIDFEGFMDGVPFEGGKGEKHPLEIGSGSFIPGFEDQVVGMKKGEEKDIVVTFPENYHAEDLAGKEATFKVKVHEIKRKQLPELNDDFAKDVDFDTLEELKADIKNKLEEKAKKDEENYRKDTVVEKAVENAQVDIPEVMIEQEIKRMTEEFEQQLTYQGMNLELYYQFSGTDEKALKEQFKDNAQIRVKTNLVLEAIAKQENIEVTEEEVEEELKRLAELYKRDLEEIKSIFTSRDNGLDGLREDLRIRKAIDFLVGQSK